MKIIAGLLLVVGVGLMLYHSYILIRYVPFTSWDSGDTLLIAFTLFLFQALVSSWYRVKTEDKAKLTDG